MSTELRVICPNRIVDIDAPDKTAVGYEITPVGALIIYFENVHAAWNVASFAPGHWSSVERPHITADRDSATDRPPSPAKP